MDVATILREKGDRTVALDPEATMAECAGVLARERIGAVLVCDGDTVAGILSERDIVRALAADGAAALDQPAGRLMTRNVVFCQPRDSIDELMQVMTDRRIRHLPVDDGGRLAGLVSIGDIVKYRLMEIETEAQSLRAYIGSG